MAGDRGWHGLINRGVRAWLASTQGMRSCTRDPMKARAKVGRCSQRLQAHGPIAKVPSIRRWRITDCRSKGTGTALCLCAHHLANALAADVHCASSQKTSALQQEDPSPLCPWGHFCAKLTKRLEFVEQHLRQSTEPRQEIRWPA